MKGFKSTSTNPYTYTQSGVWKKGQYTFQAVVLSDSGYAFAFQRSDTTWQKVDLSWQVRGGSYSKIQWTFTLEVDAVAFRLIANTVTGETIVLQPMLEKGTNGSTPIAHEEDLRGMDGDFHEFIFFRNATGIAPETPLSTQEDDYIPDGWTDNPKGVTKEIPFEFVSMREKHSGVWLDFSPSSLWAKFSEDGLSVNIRVQGHYQSHWEGVNKITEIVGGEIINGTEVIKCTAIFRKGEEDIASDVASSRGFIWEVNGVEVARDVPYITLDESYGDGFADYVTLSFLIGNKRESDQAEILNISEGMDGIGEEFIFKANNSEELPPALPSTTDEGYQNDDYHGNWSDDPVAPTESNQFVWTAKRKKVGGIWEAFGVPSVWTRWVEDGEDAIPPIIIDGYWAFWDSELQEFVESEFSAIGDDGYSPYVNDITGTWWQWSSVRGEYEDTGIKAEGKDGEDGEDGDGILEVIDYYGVSLDSNVLPTTWYTTVPTKGANEYLWNYERILYTDGTYDETEPRVIQGKDAVGIASIVNAYGYSTNYTDPPSLWYYLADLPAKQEGDVLWVRDDITYTDGTSDSTHGYPVRDGEKGADGEDGEDGDGITSTTIEYAKSSSGTTIPTTWSTSLPTPTKGMYLWTRTTTVYKKSPTTVAYSTSYWAEDGDDAKSITLSANATKITVGQGNASSPTQISVKATAVNTTVETWEYSINGGAFTATKPSFVTVVSTTECTVGSSTLFKTITLRASRVADEASDIITLSREGGAPYVDSTTRTWWEWNDSSNMYIDTGMSPVGSDGVVPYPAGYYESNKWYRREQDYTPYVQSGEVLYLLIEDTPYAGIPPTNTTYWKAFNQWEAVFISSLVAQFAKIGGAVFTGDTSNVNSNVRGRLISQKGIDNTSNYNSYTGDSGAWQPKLMLDFETGKAVFDEAKIRGEVEATSGKIGVFNIVNGKLTAHHSYMTYLPGSSIYVEVTGDIQITSGGITISNSFGGTMDHPSVVQWNIEITSGGVTVGDYEIRRDGFYESGNRIEMGAGDYIHPSTHPADMITAGTFVGIVKAYNNTSYTTKQVRNMILSTGDAVASSMANGDIWIKYE